MMKNGEQVILPKNSRVKEESNKGLNKMECFSNRNAVRNEYALNECDFD